MADIVIRKGDSALFPLTIFTGANTTGSSTPTKLPADLDTSILYFTLTDSQDRGIGGSPPSPDLALSTPVQSGILVTSAISGQARLRITSGQSWDLETGPYFYDIQVKQTGQVGITGRISGGTPLEEDRVGPIPDSVFSVATGIFNVEQW